MSPEMIAAIAPAAPAAAAPSLLPEVASAGGDFGALISRGLEQVNQKLMASQTSMQRLAMGDTQNLHQTMIEMEDTRQAFQLMVSVRSRLLEAYQDVMKMQV